MVQAGQGGKVGSLGRFVRETAGIGEGPSLRVPSGRSPPILGERNAAGRPGSGLEHRRAVLVEMDHQALDNGSPPGLGESAQRAPESQREGLPAIAAPLTSLTLPRPDLGEFVDRLIFVIRMRVNLRQRMCRLFGRCPRRL